MSEDGGFRRLTPPPHRTPGPVDVLLRWRAEILLVGAAAGLWWLTGWLGVALAAAVVAVVAVASRTARRLLGGYLLAVVAMHRVRVGLLQAGVADRTGRLPWLVHGRPGRGSEVIITVWLRAGTTVGDLRVAAPVIGAACGARSVVVERRSARSDHALLVIDRPRWPLPPV